MKLDKLMPFNIIKYYEILMESKLNWNPEYKNKSDSFEISVILGDFKLSRVECIAIAEATGNFVDSYYFKYHDCPPNYVQIKKKGSFPYDVYTNIIIYTNIINSMSITSYYNRLPDDHPLKTEEKGKIIETCINAFNAPDRKEALNEYIALVKDLNIYLELNLNLNQPKEKKELELKKRIKNYKKLQEFMVKTDTTNDKLIESINEVKNYIKEKIQLNESEDEFIERLKQIAHERVIQKYNLKDHPRHEAIIIFIACNLNIAYTIMLGLLETKALKKIEKEIKKELKLEKQKCLKDNEVFLK